MALALGGDRDGRRGLQGHGHHDQGRAVQADPIKPTSKAPETNRLKLNSDQLLYKFAFKFNLRCSSKEFNYLDVYGKGPAAGRGLHSSTIRLNVTSFRGIRWVLHFPPVYQGYVKV